jgi:hypothetical protein
MTCRAFARTNPARPEFDAAVAKLNKSGAAEPFGDILRGGEFSVTNISMIDLMQFAYRVDGSALDGSPGWFRSSRFDVVAAANTQSADPTEHCKRTTDRAGIEADCSDISMVELAKRLPSLASAYLDRPIVDLTGIAGTYNLNDSEGGLTVFDAITKQVGLRLEQRRVPLPVIAIDHVGRLAENLRNRRSNV